MNVRIWILVFAAGGLVGGAAVYHGLRSVRPLSPPRNMAKDVAVRAPNAGSRQEPVGRGPLAPATGIAVAASPKKEADNPVPELVATPVIVNAPATSADEARYAKAKWRAERQFGDFLTHFASIGGDAEKFRALLVERQSMLSDIIAAAQAQGLAVGGSQSNRSVDELIKRSFQEFNSRMKEAMGADAYREFLKFEGGKPNFNIAQNLEARLAGTSFELTEAQRTEIIAALSRAREPNGMRYTYSIYDDDGTPKPMLQIPESVLPVVKNILSPQQYEKFAGIYADQAHRRSMVKPPPR